MNLTEVSKTFKKFSVFLVGFIVFYYILILVLIPSFKTIINNIVPEKNPPTLSYGILPALEFTTKKIVGTPRYELNTTSGKLPQDIPTRSKVYEIKQNIFSFNAGKSAQDTATYLGFSDADLITDLKGTIYKWRSLKTGGTLEINIENKQLKMDTPLIGKSGTYAINGITEGEALKLVTDLLKISGRYDQMYENGTKMINMGKYLNNRLIKTEDKKEAQLYKIDLFRTMENIKILGQDPSKGLLQLYVGQDQEANRNKITTATFPVLDLNYNEINPNSEATYPLVNISKAWEAVRQGKGVIASILPRGYNPFTEYNEIEIQDILINNIYLAYYEGSIGQKYLQPIYVFEGNYKSQGTVGGDIVIYFPAIAGEYIEVTK